MPKPSRKLEILLTKALKQAGEEKVAARLKELAVASEDVLTIIANAGVHHLPERFRRGEVFTASEGSLDFSTAETVKAEFEGILRRVSTKLLERAWKSVYIIPFGPTCLSMQLKLLVYRVTGIESIDVMQIANGDRVDVDLELRELIVSGTMERTS